MQLIKQTRVGGGLIVRTCWRQDDRWPYVTQTFRGKKPASLPQSYCTREQAEDGHETAIHITRAYVAFERKQKRRKPSRRREQRLARQVEGLELERIALENELSTLRGERGMLHGRQIRTARRAVVGFLLNGTPLGEEALSLIRQAMSAQEVLHIGRALISRLQRSRSQSTC